MANDNLPDRQDRPPKSQKIGTNRPPRVEIDLRRDPADLILPCSEGKQAGTLGWHVQDVRAINRMLGLYNRLPLVCAASGCYWAKLCPSREFDFPFVGLCCPYEIEDIFYNFVRFVRELGVGPDDHVDLSMISDLVRLDLQIKRVDQQIQVEGMTMDRVAGVAQRDAKAFREKAAHPLLILQRGWRKDRAEIYRQLVASREAKQAADRADEKKTMDVLEMMSRLRKMRGDQAPNSTIVELPILTEAIELPEDYENEE
jgi:hypothetical protein